MDPFLEFIRVLTIILAAIGLIFLGFVLALVWGIYKKMHREELVSEIKTEVLKEFNK